ncbi:hypothetical protein NBO_619g0003 [Nosema bombycis CQ1]|uniref:Uncharacterized protein n=1 Tax=Nosema bombycis (strain CQ1 / CVCC 102059) TaxID=578461 RepID=R0KMS7_NOSB1|nr:hypothetical protein NBO_619g0003 [Nosema bombycis CQ1]|eukprot:EOB11951.1 hypothetical protein NBO_619g0003 [Nosema bombycis CQ1]
MMEGCYMKKYLQISKICLIKNFVLSKIYIIFFKTNTKQMDLHKKIRDSMNKTYECMFKPHIQSDKAYWHPSTVNFTGDNIKVYDLKIECLDLFCIGNYIMIIREDEIKIFLFTNEKSLKSIKSIRHHFLLFLIKKKALSEGTTNFFCKILIILVQDKTTRVSSHLEGIMLHLNIDEIIDIKEYKDFFEIEYSNGEIRYYNDKLSIICKPQTNNEDNPDHLSFKLRQNTLITLSTKNIYIFKNLIKIEFNSGLSRKKLR